MEEWNGRELDLRECTQRMKICMLMDYQVALFVTVVTAFQVPVSQSLSQDPADLTNSILTNLTSVIVQISALNGLTVPAAFAQPEAFTPSWTNQVISFLWYTSLVLSVRRRNLRIKKQLTDCAGPECYSHRLWSAMGLATRKGASW